MYQHYNNPSCLCAKCNINDLPASKYIIQKVWLQHDWLYASLDLIPAHSLDGKDIPSEYYIIVSEPTTELPAHAIVLYRTENEAREAMNYNDHEEL